MTTTVSARRPFMDDLDTVAVYPRVPLEASRAADLDDTLPVAAVAVDQSADARTAVVDAFDEGPGIRDTFTDRPGDHIALAGVWTPYGGPPLADWLTEATEPALPPVHLSHGFVIHRHLRFRNVNSADLTPVALGHGDLPAPARLVRFLDELGLTEWQYALAARSPINQIRATFASAALASSHAAMLAVGARTTVDRILEVLGR